MVIHEHVTACSLPVFILGTCRLEIYKITPLAFILSCHLPSDPLVSWNSGVSMMLITNRETCYNLLIGQLISIDRVSILLVSTQSQ